jgi:hypothetical protein
MTWQTILGHLAVQLALVAFTVLIHSAAMVLVLRHVVRNMPSARTVVPFHRSATFLFRVVVMILVAHLLEMMVWGLAFDVLGIFPDSFTAYYFAMETYTTLGYGDVLLPADWRLTSGWLATTGLLMFGWSTAVFATIINRLNESHMERLAAHRDVTRHMGS